MEYGDTGYLHFSYMALSNLMFQVEKEKTVRKISILEEELENLKQEVQVQDLQMEDHSGIVILY